MSRLAVPLLVFVLTGCNSSDSSEEQDPPQLPEISTFTATPSSIDEGSGTELLAVFTNGTSAQVDNGIETVVSNMLSNVPVWMVPRESTTYTLTVTNEDGEVVASVDVTVDERPILTVTKPLDHSVARPEVAVAASCTDDRGDCDISVSVAIPELAVAAPCSDECKIGISRNYVFSSATDELSEVVDLSEFEGQLISLQFSATDSALLQDSEDRLVYVETSPPLANERAFRAPVVDLDGQRALLLERSPDIDKSDLVTIVEAASGSEENVDVPGMFIVRAAYLTPTGAAFDGIRVREGASGLPEAYDWNHSLLVQLGRQGYSLQVAGDYASWVDESNNDLLRRRFSTMTNLKLHDLVYEEGPSVMSRHSVGSNGVVAFSTRTSLEAHDQMMTFDGGVATLLTADADRHNRHPRTDGHGVVYTKTDGASYEIAFHDGSDEIILSGPRPRIPRAGIDYAIAGGWVAFTELGDLDQTQVWTRDPAGTPLQRTAFDVYSWIETLSPDGEVMVVTEQARYLSRPTGELTLVSSELGQSTKIGDTWYVIMGRSVFEVR